MAERQTSHRFTAWSGVFTPSLLTILGVIMYLRLGWVVGHAGLLGALAIIFLAHAISVPTSLSIASLASNRSIGGGGVYYIISRSLGLPVGASIGVALYLATALGASLYIIGFAKTFNTAIGWEESVDNIRITGSVTLFLLTALTIISAELAIKTQYVIMLAIVASIVSLVAGTSPQEPTEIAMWPAATNEPMNLVFAVYFPAVTGFTAGVAMSGDLKDPRKDIPAGTLWAVATGFVIYVGLAIFLGMRVDGAVLRGDMDVWFSMALVPEAVIAGVFGATLSSAIGSMLGAPRILQALALDGVGPRILAQGSKATNEPRAAILATFVIAEAGILVADLDLVARVLTMFFLTTYGTLNLACGLERWSNPDFRPRLRVPAWLSFAGAAVCLGMMFKLDAAAMFGAIGALALLYLFVKQRRLELESNAIWAVIWEQMVRAGLYRLARAGARTATWRPNVLLFGGHPDLRPHLLQMAQWIVQEHGLLTNFVLEPTKRRPSGRISLAGGPAEPTNPDGVALAKHYDSFDLHSVFHTQRQCSTVPEGIRMASEWFGLVGMEPNAVMMGWPQQPSRHPTYGALVGDLMSRDHNMLLLEVDPHVGFRHRRKLDIWWGRNQINGGLMLMLAHFIQSTPAWNRARVRIVTLVDGPEEVEPRRKALKRLLGRGRVRAEVIVMDGSAEADDPITVLRGRSKRVDLLIMGVPRPREGEAATWVDTQAAKTQGIRAVLRVSASESHAGGKPLGLEDDVHTRVDEGQDTTNPAMEAVVDAD